MYILSYGVTMKTCAGYETFIVSIPFETFDAAQSARIQLETSEYDGVNVIHDVNIQYKEIL